MLATSLGQCFLHCSFGLGICFSPLDVLPFIVKFLAFCETKLDFDFPALEVDAKRDKGQSFDGGLTPESLDLLFVEEELTGTEGVVVEDAGGLIGADVEVVEEDLHVLDSGEAIAEVTLAEAEGLDFRSEESDARLDLFKDDVVPQRLAVGYDCFNVIHC